MRKIRIKIYKFYHFRIKFLKNIKNLFLKEILRLGLRNPINLVITFILICKVLEIIGL